MALRLDLASLPDIYALFPEHTRVEDNFIVGSDGVEFQWDDPSVQWDEVGVQWDKLVFPEPILRLTTRVLQRELNQFVQDVDRFLTIFDVDATDPEFLPYLASLLGFTLNTEVGDLEQREFIKKLVNWYRIKGTRQSFFVMFRSLGFEPTILQLYQINSEPVVVSGSPVDVVTGFEPDLLQDNTIDNEVITTGDGVTTAFGDFFLNNAALMRGTVQITVEDVDLRATDTAGLIDPSIGTMDGPGFISGTTIEYKSGKIVALTFDTAPATGKEIRVSYSFFRDAYPNPYDNAESFDVPFGSGIEVFSSGVAFRSSFFDLTLVPINPALGLDITIIIRILDLLDRVKPAHSVVRNLTLAIILEDLLVTSDELDIILKFVPEFFPTDLTLYHGKGIDINCDPFAALRDGLGVHPGQPAANPIQSGTVTSDAAPTTTSFTTALVVLGAPNLSVPTQGPINGESRVVSSIVDGGSFRTVNLSTALSVAPTIGDSFSLLDGTAQRGRLTTDPQDELEFEAFNQPGNTSAGPPVLLGVL